MNKRIEILLCFYIALIVSCVITCYTVTDNLTQTNKDDIDYRPTVVIDAGHGGEDSGAVASDNILEKNINLDISLRLKSIFEANGFNVLLTRTSDTAFYDENTYKKRYDLDQRIKLFNASSDNIVISIHQNKFIDPQYSGTQVFFSKNDADSEVLANCIQNSVCGLLQPENQRECKEAGSEILVLDKAVVPAVMVECGFLSNTNELEKLITSEYQNEVAYSIFLGFLEYYYINY